jgi:hypothetical protein
MQANATYAAILMTVACSVSGAPSMAPAMLSTARPVKFFRFVRTLTEAAARAVMGGIDAENLCCMFIFLDLMTT